MLHFHLKANRKSTQSLENDTYLGNRFFFHLLTFSLYWFRIWQSRNIFYNIILSVANHRASFLLVSSFWRCTSLAVACYDGAGVFLRHEQNDVNYCYEGNKKFHVFNSSLMIILSPLWESITFWSIDLSMSETEPNEYFSNSNLVQSLIQDLSKYRCNLC